MIYSNLSDSDLQSLVFLVALLAYLCFSTFSNRKANWSQILKSLGLWLIAGLIIIVVYSFRYELSDVKNRVLLEVNPSSAVVDKEGKVVINVAQDGHYYINLKLNGHPVKFMVDTGASDMVLNVDEAKKIGIDLNSLEFNRPYQTANGRSWGALVVVSQVEIGDIKFKDVEVSVNNANMGTSLLGMGFLKRFSRYEFYRDKLELTK